MVGGAGKAAALPHRFEGSRAAAGGEAGRHRGGTFGNPWRNGGVWLGMMISFRLKAVGVLSGLLLLAGVAGAAEVFEPGAVWPDDQGQHIQAHGGGVIRLGDTYYWFGEDRAQTNGRGWRCVSCYSSKDLAHWTHRGQVFRARQLPEFTRGWILERPKVFYNAKTKKYVMYMHLDGPMAGQPGSYAMARVGVAVCDTVDGQYQFVKSFRPLGQQSRDIGQFIDDDGSAYLIFEDRPNGFHIAQLSEDYLDVAKEVCLIPEHLEGGAVVHYQGLYYAIGSHLTGWGANPNVYATAKSLAGPWSEFRDLAPRELNTYGSQSSMLLPVTGTKGTTVIFMGDIWKPESQWDSRYLWMPLQIGDGRMWLPAPQKWSLDMKTGVAEILQP